MRILIMAGLLLAGLTAAAQANDSAYVRTLDDCTRQEAKDEPVTYLTCTGYGEWMVYIIAGEHGIAVAYSDRGRQEQWSHSPPRAGVFQDLGEVSDWRLDDNGTAFATIQRSIFTGFEAGEGGQYLTVSALRPEGDPGACHVAYVEAAQQPDANQIARDAADYLAPGWQCGVDEPIIFDLSSEMDVMSIAAQRRAGH